MYGCCSSAEACGSHACQNGGACEEDAGGGEHVWERFKRCGRGLPCVGVVSSVWVSSMWAWSHSCGRGLYCMNMVSPQMNMSHHAGVVSPQCGRGLARVGVVTFHSDVVSSHMGVVLFVWAWSNSHYRHSLTRVGVVLLMWAWPHWCGRAPFSPQGCAAGVWDSSTAPTVSCPTTRVCPSRAPTAGCVCPRPKATCVTARWTTPKHGNHRNAPLTFTSMR